MSLAQNTLLLDVAIWDLVLDASGNIAMASPPYALAQDVASAIRTFLGEVYYDTTLGVPYGAKILGRAPPLNVFQSLMVDAALTVPGVVSASCTVTSIVDRTLTGQVTFVDDNGQQGTVSLSSAAVFPGLGPGPGPEPGSSWTADSTVVTADSTTFTAGGGS